MESQNKLILEHLRSGKTITALEALEKFHCFRLASRINDIRNGMLQPNESLISAPIKIPSGKTIHQYSIETIKNIAA